MIDPRGDGPILDDRINRGGEPGGEGGGEG